MNHNENLLEGVHKRAYLRQMNRYKVLI